MSVVCERLINSFLYYVFVLILFAVVAAPVPALAAIEPDFRVALIDRFFPGENAFSDPREQELDLSLYGMFDLDGDARKEPYYHGDVVRLLISHPRIAVVPYVLETGVHNVIAIKRKLELVRRDLFWGEPISAVLLPWESSTLLMAFDHQLRPQKVSQYLAMIRDWGEQDPIWHHTFEIILILEDLVAMGARVFTIAGNGGRRMVNTYSFAEGVITVGAEERELKHFIADNAFVDTYAPAAYQLRRIDNERAIPQGYDLDNDGCVDVAIQSLSNQSRLPSLHWKVLKGSSFAAPVALKRAILGNYTRRCHRATLSDR
ncbi:MAG: hypothetical protein R3183_07155 [Oleiphilaceae bacterium]|nr:hypothetical protein [Oleiphilaceae bacterium]